MRRYFYWWELFGLFSAYWVPPIMWNVVEKGGRNPIPQLHNPTTTTQPELDNNIKEQVAKLNLDVFLFLVFSRVAIPAKIILILYIISVTFTL